MLDLVFRGASGLALLGWVGLAAATLLPRHRSAIRTVTGIVIPAVLAFAYVALIAGFRGTAEGGFGSIAAVRALFDTPGLLVAGWLHYLAFDLVVGTWISREGERAGIGAAWLLPCYGLTFLFGPAGFLLFLLLRAVQRQAPARLATESRP